MIKKRSMLHIVRKLVIGVMALFALPQAYAQQPPANLTLKYDVKMNGVTLGEAVHQVRMTKNTYSIIDVEKATGIVGLFTNSITRKSQGTIVNRQFRPTQYSETAKKKTRTAKMDWATKTATFSVEPDKVDTFSEGMVDRVTFPYQYYLAQKAPPAGLFKQEVADVKRVEDQQFKTVGKVTIDTPMGRMDTILVERAGDSKNMKMWLSPNHQYLPVRVMYIDKKENVFDQVIVEIVQGS